MKTAHRFAGSFLFIPGRQLLFFMKLTTILLVCVGMLAQAKTYAWKINLQLRKSTIKHLLNEVEKQTLYRFAYHGHLTR